MLQACLLSCIYSPLLKKYCEHFRCSSKGNKKKNHKAAEAFKNKISAGRAYFKVPMENMFINNKHMHAYK